MQHALVRKQVKYLVDKAAKEAVEKIVARGYVENEEERILV